MSDPMPTPPEKTNQPGSPCCSPAQSGSNIRNLLIICALVDLVLIGGLVYYFLLKPATVEPAKTGGTIETTQTVESAKDNAILESSESVVTTQVADTTTPPANNYGITEQMPLPRTFTTNTFTIDEIAVGDTIMGLQITALEPANAGYSKLAADNVTIQFKGELTISGEYDHWGADSMVGEQVCFMPDSESKKLLPYMEGDTRDGHFCFVGKLTNIEKANSEFGPAGSKGTAKVTISDFFYAYYPSEGSNSATLVKVLEKN